MQEYLILVDDNVDRISFIRKLSEISDFPIDIFNGVFGVAVSFNWINSMEDMKAISEIYRDRVITLQYMGDKVSSTYREYYLNGKVQIVPVRMSFDEFNENFLSL